MILLHLLLYTCIPLCNSVMDVLKDHHKKSIFQKHLTGYWADATLVSCNNKYNFNDPLKGRRKWFWNIDKPVELLSAWHLFKFFMFVFITLAIISFPGNTSLLQTIMFLATYGLLWKFVFEPMYNYFLIKH